MSIYDVGVENLPNVYIDKIKIFRGLASSPLYKCEVDLSMVDEMNDGLYSWHGRDELQFQIKIMLLHDQGELSFVSVQNALRDGSLSLYSFGDRSSNSYKFMELSKTSFNDFKAQNLYFSLPLNITQLDVYAAAFIPGFGFTNPVFNKFYGPMSSERVIINNRVNKSSGYFYNPETNEEYRGPVHQHNGKWMVGSNHTNEPHASLRYVPVANTKIETEDGLFGS